MTLSYQAASRERPLRLPLHFAERRILLTVLDLFAVNAALLLTLGVRSPQGLHLGVVVRQPLWFLILSAIWLAAAHAVDLYETRIAGRFVTSLPAVAKAGLVTVFLYLLVPYITPALPTHRIMLVSFPLLLISTVILGRCIYMLVLPKPAYERHALIVGAGWAGRTIAQAMLENGQIDYTVVGFVDDDPKKAGKFVPVVGESALAPPPGRDPPRGMAAENFPVLGNRRSIRDLIGQHHVSTLILAITDEVDSDLMQILMDCVEKGAEMIPMPVIYEQITGRVPVEHVGDRWYAALPIHPKVTGGLWQITKRFMDVVLGLFGLICLVVVTPFVAVAIVLDSWGPVFYLQERVGKGGRIFRTYKFRSMARDAEQEGAVWAQERDPRATRVGRILRATHLDEWPQFLNVVRGDMSVVGPRPERPEFVERFVEEIPIYRLRHTLKPGMAGWGLIRQGYAGTKEDVLIRLQYDLYYIKHQSLWLDLFIIVKTIVHAVTLKGR